MRVAILLSALLAAGPALAQSPKPATSPVDRSLDDARTDSSRRDVEKYMAEGKPEVVLQKLAGAHNLGTPLPPDMLALEARLSAEAGDVLRAKTALDAYFSKVQASDPDYAASRALLRQIEPKLAKAKADRIAQLAAAAKESSAREGDVRERMAETAAARKRIEADVARRVEYFRDCPTCPEMTPIKPGGFLNGDPTGIGSKDERPAHYVTIAKPYALGRYEVTFDEWDACVADGGCKSKANDEGWGRGQLPVINVNWFDAQEYVTWLSAKTGQRYRLPSNAEWEFAARAGTTTDFHWGATISHEFANYGGEECCGGKVEGTDQWFHTAPTGSFAPNANGLYDVLGNVREWTEDCSHDNGYVGAPTDGSAWLTACDTDGDFRAYRGGSWGVMPFLIRVSNKGRIAPDVKFNNLGFRVARDLP